MITLRINIWSSISCHICCLILLYITGCSSWNTVIQREVREECKGISVLPDVNKAANMMKNKYTLADALHADKLQKRDHVILKKNGYVCIRTTPDMIDKPNNAQASIPKDAIIFGLKEFCKLSGTEPQFSKIVDGIQAGLRTFGYAAVVLNYGEGMMIQFGYKAELRHLVVMMHRDLFTPTTNSIDMSNVDVDL
jgi:hypothetical protein